MVYANGAAAIVAVTGAALTYREELSRYIASVLREVTYARTVESSSLGSGDAEPS
jgi:hypothetical protein